MASHLVFVVKSLVLSIVKLSNLAILIQRALTVLLVLAHYQYIEGIDYWSQSIRQNEIAFGMLIVMWHVVSMNFKVAEESRRMKHATKINAIIFLCGLFGIPALITIVMTPLLAWLNFGVTTLDSSYWTLRYMMVLLYIALNSITSVFPHVHNFLFFLSDGLILSQLTSLYLYNEFSMSALLTCLPVLFVLHNHLLVKGLSRFVKDETSGKLTFLRLIGRHDAVFLFVIYSVFTTLFVLVDACSKPDLRLAANIWYLLYALYAFGKLMDHKQSQSKWLLRLSLLTVFIFTAVHLSTM